MATLEMTSCDAGCGAVSDKSHVSPLNRPGGWCRLEVTHQDRGWTMYDLCSLECLGVIAMRLNGFGAEPVAAIDKPKPVRRATPRKKA